MFLERYRDLVSEDGRILAIIDESVLSGKSYARIRGFIRENFIVVGVVSLPGDAFRRASARVKTSVLILRLRKPGESQPDVFMASAIYVGLEDKIARRIGVGKIDLQEEKAKEIDRIVSDYAKFSSGIPGPYLVPATRLQDRLDVKYCIEDRGRKKSVWLEKDLQVTQIDKVLSIASERRVKVKPGETYQFLRVSYGGEVSEGDEIEGEDCSYSTLYVVEEWDCQFSPDMGPPIFGQDGPLAEIAHGKLLLKKW